MSARIWRNIVLVFVCAIPCRAAEPSKPTGFDENFPKDIVLKKFPNIRVDGKGLADAVEALRQQTHINILVDWHSLESVKIDKTSVVRYSGQNVTLLDALAKIIESLSKDLMMNPTHGAILILTKEAMKSPRGWMGLTALPSSTKRDDMAVSQKLHKKVGRVTFDGVGFEDAIDFFKDPKTLQLTIKIDWDALKQAGVDTKAPVELVLQDVLGSDAIYWVVHSIDAKEPLAYSIRDGALRISTQKLLRAP